MYRHSRKQSNLWMMIYSCFVCTWAFACSLRVGEITGLTWDDVIIDEEAIANNNARVIVNKELARISQSAMQKLKEKDIIKNFPNPEAPLYYKAGVKNTQNRNK